MRNERRADLAQERLADVVTAKRFNKDQFDQALWEIAKLTYQDLLPPGWRITQLGIRLGGIQALLKEAKLLSTLERKSLIERT